MSLDLYPQENAERALRLDQTTSPEAGAFDGFARGTGMLTMRGVVRAGSAVSQAVGALPVAADAITGGTDLQDRYFKAHDNLFGKAMEWWTPNTEEVGVAAEVTGTLLSTLPLVVINPSLAVATTEMGAAEDLVKKGVDPGKAIAVGAVQGAGLGLGIYAPILGKTLAQRMLLGGAGFNVVQGTAMRGASDLILEGTPGENDYAAFDATQLTLDVLLGLAFGGIAHLSPAQRAQGAETMQRIENWAKNLKPSDVDALAVMRQAQHINSDSMPGIPKEPVDIDRHVQSTRQAIEQLVRDEPVNVSDLPQAKFEADPVRMQEMEANVKTMTDLAEQVRQAEGLPPVETIASEAPAAIRGATQPPPRGPRGGEAAGAEVIPRAENLSPANRDIETRFAEQIAEDVEGAVEAYKRVPGAMGGKVINTDLVRELSEDYVQNRSGLSSAVHEPASWLTKEIYKRELANPDPTGRNIVTFTAGGTGAGKTTAIAGVPAVQRATQRSQIVYDTNMNTYKSSVTKIDQALKAGKTVRIVTVVRDPVDALVSGALPRAERMGRTVRLDEHAKTHIGVVETIPRLMEKYQGDKRVKFDFIDNTGGKNDVKLGSKQLLSKLDLANLESRLNDALEQEHQSGRISDEVYRGTRGDVGSSVRNRAEQDVAGGAGPRQPGSDGVRPQAADSGSPEVDPLRLEAERFAAEQPDLMLTVGQNADGTPILQSVRQYLDEARQAADNAREDAALFDIAAQCLMRAA